MLEFVRQRRINEGVVIIICYISLCCSNFWASAGNVALTNALAQGDQSIQFLTNNAIFAFVIAGLFPFVIYEIFTSMFLRSMARSVPEAPELRYAMRVFFVLANLVAAALKLAYLFNPVFFVFGEVFINFVCYVLFYALFCVWVMRNCIDKTSYATFLFATAPLLFGAYIIISLLTVLEALV